MRAIAQHGVLYVNKLVNGRPLLQLASTYAYRERKDLAASLNIVVLPVLFEGDVKAVIELASLDRFSDTHLTFLDQLTESVGVVMNTI